MENHPEQIKNGLVRRNGEVTPFNAGDAMAVVCSVWSGPLPRVFRARLARAAKELLEDGFEPNVVCAAMLAGLRKARVHLVPDLALELVIAERGQRVEWSEWRKALDNLNADANGSVVSRVLREKLREERTL